MRRSQNRAFSALRCFQCVCKTHCSFCSFCGRYQTQGGGYVESNERPLKTLVLGLRILQPEATCFLWLCTPAFLTERERPRMDPLMPPQGSILIPFSFSSLDPSFSRFSITTKTISQEKKKSAGPRPGMPAPSFFSCLSASQDDLQTNCYCSLRSQ